MIDLEVQRKYKVYFCQTKHQFILFVHLLTRQKYEKIAN